MNAGCDGVRFQRRGIYVKKTNMWTSVSALCVLWVTPVCCIFLGSCPRKEPPPGVVVVLPGSELVLTCSGHVTVDGVKVMSNANTRQRSFAAVTQSTVNPLSSNTVLQSKYTAVNRNSEGQTFSTLLPTGVSHPLGAKSEWDTGHKQSEEEYNEEEEGGEIVSEGVKSKYQWKSNSKDLLDNRLGPTMSLSPVRMADSGRYSCRHEGTERFSVRVIVAEAPETPHLSCYKKSASSKIRCEWTPQKPVIKGTSCSLLIRKSLTGSFVKVPCSYSNRHSRCWCAMDHNENEKRTLHQAFLCVTSITSNTTSDLISFKPMQIIKPDPPYNVSVQQEKGLNRTLTVKWRPPYSWKFQDHFYALIYEIQYKPIKSSHFQTRSPSDQTTKYTITDAETGHEYEVQVRAKEEYDGSWSKWSAPAYGTSWTDTPSEDLFETPFPYPYSEGSGSEEPNEEMSSSKPVPQAVSHHFLWVTLSLGILLASSAAVYIFRDKDQCMSKLQSLSVVAQCKDSVHPLPTPAVAEGHTLLNGVPPLNEVKERNEQEQRILEAVNFNNTSYFLVMK